MIVETNEKRTGTLSYGELKGYAFPIPASHSATRGTSALGSIYHRRAL